MVIKFRKLEKQYDYRFGLIIAWKYRHISISLGKYKIVIIVRNVTPSVDG